MSEKLSALFFNQTTLIEKWSRQFGDNTSNRLKFGYNYRGLLSALEIDYKDGSLSVMNNTLYRIHRWIDRRIDQGCIVPQYIIDNEKGQWDRVFRPGENEDAILSTLTRFVAYVIDTIKKEFNVHFIPELILKKILCVIVEKCSPNLQDLLRIRMVILGSGLSFICEDDYVNKTYDVVDYLNAMHVLEDMGNYVDISKRFVGTEQVMNTNFSKETEGVIAFKISEFHKKLVDSKIDFFISYSLCNYYLKEHFTFKHEEEASLKSLEKLSTAVEMLMKKKDEVAKTEAKNNLYEAFCLTRFYIMPKSVSEESIYNSRLYENHIYVYQRKFSRINFAINLLLLIFYSSDTDKLRAFVKANLTDDDYTDYLGSGELLKSIQKDLDKEKNVIKIAADQGRMRLLLRFINETERENE